MPGLNGLQLYYRLKAINRNMKILFVSALDAVPELVSILPDVKTTNDIIKKPVADFCCSCWQASTEPYITPAPGQN